MKWMMSSLALAAFVVNARAADDNTRATSDADFLVKSTVCNHCEVKLSEHAAKNATDPKVKEFAQKIAKEHADAADNLSKEAKRMKVAVVAGTEKDTKEKMDRLTKLNGADYDKEYMRMMIEAHQNAIKLFDSEANNGSDADLKKFATTMIPTLKKHLEEAQSISDNLK